jgi:acylglycerol lipase
MAEQDLINRYGALIPGISVLFPIEDWMTFITRDGFRLHTYKYPASSIRCVILSLHGLHSYSQPTGIIAKFLAEAGFEVVAFDHRGHGKSEGPRAYFTSVSVLVNDTLEFIKELKKLYGDLPLFLMGGSLGGAVCINVALELGDKIAGIILINPAIGIDTRLEGCMRGIANCFASCCPMMPVAKGDLFRTSKNELLHKFMNENPYYYNGKIKVGTSAAMLNAMRDLRKRYRFFKTRVLLIQGGNDQVTNVRKVQSFMKKIEVEDKTLLMYPGRPHSIVFEDVVFEIAEKITEWVRVRVEKNENKECVVMIAE